MIKLIYLRHTHTHRLKISSFHHHHHHHHLCLMNLTSTLIYLLLISVQHNKHHIFSFQFFTIQNENFPFFFHKNRLIWSEMKQNKNKKLALHLYTQVWQARKFHSNIQFFFVCFWPKQTIIAKIDKFINLVAYLPAILCFFHSFTCLKTVFLMMIFDSNHIIIIFRFHNFFFVFFSNFNLSLSLSSNVCIELKIIFIIINHKRLLL